MRTFGRILGRLIAVALSYVAACVVAGLMVAGSHVAQAWLAGSIAISSQRLAAETLYVSGLLAAFGAVYAFAPAVIAITAGEIFAIRRALYYVLSGGLAGALGYAAFAGHGLIDAPDLVGRLALFAGVGLAAGFVYWYLGGRSAGVLGRPAA